MNGRQGDFEHNIRMSKEGDCIGLPTSKKEEVILNRKKTNKNGTLVLCLCDKRATS